MSITFILIMILSNGGQPYTVTAEFNSLDNCQFAMSSIKDNVADTRILYSKCLPK